MRAKEESEPDPMKESEPSPMKNLTTVERKSDRELVVTRIVRGPA